MAKVGLLSLFYCLGHCLSLRSWQPFPTFFSSIAFFCCAIIRDLQETKRVQDLYVDGLQRRAEEMEQRAIEYQEQVMLSCPTNN